MGDAPIQQLKRLKAIEHELDAWFLEAISRKSTAICSPSKADDASAGTQTTYLLDVVLDTLWWTAMLLLRIALLDLSSRLSTRHTLLSDLSSREESSTSKVDECVHNLQDMVVVLLGDRSGTMLQVAAARLPLHFLEAWHDQRGDIEGKAWCRDHKTKALLNAPFLDWDALLPWSLFIITWLVM